MSPNLNRETKPFVAETREPVPRELPAEREPETIEQHEQESHAPRQEEVEESVYGKITAPQPVQRSAEPQPIGIKPQSLVQVEAILEEHIAELFQRLPDKDKPLFKERGEQAAQEIHTLLGQTKVQVKKIFNLIFSWLSIIPGINKFFVEQQAEIKTNKLLALKDKQH